MQAIILGLVQGLTEFLPVSSTAHLTVFPWLVGWDSPLLNSLTFDVALHMGTLAAVLLFFWRDWVALAGGFLASLRTRRLVDPRARLAWLVILGTIPAVIVGLLFERLVESSFRSPIQIALVLAAFSFVFLWAEWVARQRRGAADLRVWEAVAIGFAQAIAVVPGVSRSGATISAGLLLGLDRASAARFSFLLATPIIGGAGAKRLLELRNAAFAGDDVTLMIVGALVAAVSGWLCIRWLLAYLSQDSLRIFVWYRLAVAAVIALVFVARGGGAV